MNGSRARIHYPATLAVVLLTAASACNGQYSNETLDGVTMNNPPNASRPPAPEIEPIVHNGLRYEQDRVDASSGDQNGGYLAAFDPRTGERVWRLQVYEVPDQSAQGLPNIGRYFRSMRLVPGRDQIEIENESGGRYLVDLTNRTSTQVGGPPPTGAQPTAPPRPKPEPE